MSVQIRPAGRGDVEAVAAIYSHAVHHGIATFDLADPPAEYWQDKIAGASPDCPVLVAVRETTVLGYAYAGPFRPKPAYSATRETTVYLSPTALGQGVGTLLYAQLLDQLRCNGIRVAVAVIAQPNPASVALHEKLGFSAAGRLPEVGRKFDRWIDIAFYHKVLADPGSPDKTTS